MTFEQIELEKEQFYEKYKKQKEAKNNNNNNIITENILRGGVKLPKEI